MTVRLSVCLCRAYVCGMRCTCGTPVKLACCLACASLACLTPNVLSMALLCLHVSCCWLGGHGCASWAVRAGAGARRCRRR